MVQEVQTSLTWYEIPNRIEGIWISERRIKEHYQVTPTFNFECSCGSSLSMYGGSSQRDVPDTKWTLSLTQSWPTEFKIIDGRLRIPLAWWYKAVLSIGWWTSNFMVTPKIKLNWEIILSADFYNSSTSKEMILNLGKFDLIEFSSSAYYVGTSSWATTSAWGSIQLQKL